MRISSAKQEALAVIQGLPDNVDIEEIMYRLYVLENVQRGRQDAEQAKITPAEQVLKEIEAW